MKAYALPLLLLSQLCLTSAQVYIAIADMEGLLDTQQKIVEDLNLYIENEEKRIKHLKRTMQTFMKENQEARYDVDNYLGNPVNAFTLMKRLSTDLDNIERWSNAGVEHIKRARNRPEVKYATQNDLKGAAEALVRVKDMYKLNITDLVEGRVEGFSKPMMTADCFELGKILYNKNDLKNALPLFTVALNKYDELEDGPEPTKAEISNYLAYTHYLLGESNGRFNEDFQKEVNEGEEEKEFSVDMDYYEALCRGDIKVPDSATKSLRCRYMSENHPFLRLAPFKQEQVYSKPDIYLFHDVINDDEIHHIQESAKPTLFPSATTGLGINATSTVSSYRLSKTTFLYNETEVTMRLSRRVSHMTGLDMMTSEVIQVVNYGVGGYYYWHHDSAIFEERHGAFPGQGNRIATVLFYLSDVALGGATVFTKIGLRVPPKKHSAVFWTNLHASGEPDFAVTHASCAVAKGSKWIATKWLHQYGQELIKPCNLEYQPQGIQWPIAPPVRINKSS